MTISVGGLLSSLDTSSIVSQLLQIKRAPVTLLENKKAGKETELSAFRMINTKLSGLMSVMTSMDSQDEFLSKKGSFTNNNSSDNNSVISLSTTSTVTAGSYSLIVSQLAQANKLVHSGASDQTTAISSNGGTFSFTYQETETTISVSTSTTLSSLKTAINNANAGVTATIINTGETSNNYRLILTANDTGTDNAITISSSSILYSGFSTQQEAQDSIITIDGLSVSRESNSLTDVVEGSTITLGSIGSGTITFSNDIDMVKGKLDGFVTSYNDLITTINSSLKYDSTSGATGVLFANSTLISLKNTLQDIVTTEVAGLSENYTRLSQIGFKTDSTAGTLSITSSDLSDAMEADFENIGKLFTSFGSATDGRVTFVDFSSETEAGTYELTGVAGFAARGFIGLGIQKEGESGGRSMEGDGGSSFFTGKSGFAEAGLKLRVEGDDPGSYGTVTFSLGIAAKLFRELNILTDQSIDGPIVTEINALTGTIDDIDDQIDATAERLTIFEKNLRTDFVNLEVQLSRLQSQGEFLTSALAGLSTGSKK